MQFGTARKVFSTLGLLKRSRAVESFSTSTTPSAAQLILRCQSLATAFRTRGHLVADTDPLRKSLVEIVKSQKLRSPPGASFGYFKREKNTPFLQRKVVDEPVENTDLHRLVSAIDSLTDKDTKTLDLSPWGLDKKTKFHEPLPKWMVEQLLDLPEGEPAALSLPRTAGDFVSFMARCYCGSVGIEYRHITHLKEFRWLQHRIEHTHLSSVSKDRAGRPQKYASLGAFINPKVRQWSEKQERKPDKFVVPDEPPCDSSSPRQSYFGLDLDETSRLVVWEQLLKAEFLESFLASKYPNVKTFGLSGAESLIPGLSALFSRASELGTRHIEMGMSHRGRLNILMNLLGKPLGTVCTEFNDSITSDEIGDLKLGDVKYHLGTSATVTFPGALGNECHPLEISILPNPSHLEQVTPVVTGKVRAKQYYMKDWERRKVLGVVLHGDAAFCGQGIVAETLALSQLPAFYTGGTVHIVINNNIGFTTESSESHSSVYPTDLAKAVGAPVFHVNGDDPEAVVRVMRMAIEYRHRFQKDVIVDFICFRRAGHSEAEDPTITQPIRHQVIANHPSTLTLFEERLLSAGLLSKEFTETMKRTLLEEAEQEFNLAKTAAYAPTSNEWLASNWQGVAVSSGLQRPTNMTGGNRERMELIGRALSQKPKHLDLHPDVEAILDKRRKAIDTGEGIDMSFAESLAFGLLSVPVDKDSETPTFGKREIPGIERAPSNRDVAGSFRSTFLPPILSHPTVHVRLSGQDCERGTFNQRHALLVCQSTNRRYWPLSNIVGPGEQEEIHICNSNLSEAAVLGFEYGYSLENDNALVVWEAQFGDFANVAQPMIDNFIVSGEHKWSVQSNLVMLLPHGLEGAGPEHSSARPERFLQLVDDDPNVVNHIITPEMRKDLEFGFHAADVDGDGRIGLIDLTNLLGKTLDPEEVGERWDIIVKETSIQSELKGGVDLEQYIRFASSWLLRNAESMTNFSVCAPTTPANYFHMLRRQIHRPFSKPLVVLTPKALHHHRPCVSSLHQMTTGTFFRRCISESALSNNMQTSKRYKFDLLPNDQIRRVVLVAGRMYYDLYHARTKKKARDVAFIRLEQIAPFPHDRVAEIVRRYKNAEIVFAQEEPENQGFWTYVGPRLHTAIRVFNEEDPLSRNIRVICRNASATPAHGSFRVHHDERKNLIDEVFS